MDEMLEKFKGIPADFTPEQAEYIRKMFDKKGPVLVRMGVKKCTRFYSPVEWDIEKSRYYPKKERGKK